MRLALAHPQEDVIPELTLPAFSKVSRTSVNKWVSNFCYTAWRGWIVSVHQADPPSSAPNSYPSLSEYIDQQSRLAIGGRLRH